VIHLYTQLRLCPSFSTITLTGVPLRYMRTAIRRRRAIARSNRDACPITHLLYEGEYGAVHDVLNTLVVYDVLNSNK